MIPCGLRNRQVAGLDLCDQLTFEFGFELSTNLSHFEYRTPRPRADKIDAREGLCKIAREHDFGNTQLWTRVNSLDSPWVLDDLIRLVGEIGDKLDVVMIPKVEGPWDIHYVDQLLAQLEARAGLRRPLLVHAILETHLGVVNVEEICAASPRMQGLSFGPADLAASRRMKTTRVGGGHPGYLVRTDPDPKNPDAPRVTAQQDPWHYTLARMVDACTASRIFPYYGPFGDIADTLACEDQFRAAFLLGCVGAWSLHPAQIEIARRVFTPPVEEVRWARRVHSVRAVHRILRARCQHLRSRPGVLSRRSSPRLVPRQAVARLNPTSLHPRRLPR